MALWRRQKPGHKIFVGEGTREISGSRGTELEKRKAKLNTWEKVQSRLGPGSAEQRGTRTLPHCQEEHLGPHVLSHECLPHRKASSHTHFLAT